MLLDDDLMNLFSKSAIFWLAADAWLSKAVFKSLLFNDDAVIENPIFVSLFYKFAIFCPCVDVRFSRTYKDCIWVCWYFICCFKSSI
jgi:hypothetical protein